LGSHARRCAGDVRSLCALRVSAGRDPGARPRRPDAGAGQCQRRPCHQPAQPRTSHNRLLRLHSRRPHRNHRRLHPVRPFGAGGNRLFRRLAWRARELLYSAIPGQWHHGAAPFLSPCCLDVDLDPDPGIIRFRLRCADRLHCPADHQAGSASRCLSSSDRRLALFWLARRGVEPKRGRLGADAR